ncbi:BZ3500_MvSof-1268-A1-R1_Chr12-2g03774 [Microbotryum saponariae]|uniref:DNA-directed RNA polymerases I and III subunit RPAC1 n=1 Tax=Microbotryum saponariae TaxID=289078 RepID=A0A2X0KQ84_9BASI|nr:BZ3500_MvSof-1268-A1-R1_Chr12-2g03774 [Microbotryum saponariae]SDA02384.1 BZ3501_MvSof-1269-A2-R1_Chr12-3g03570 [Microbotryum saponariae]
MPGTTHYESVQARRLVKIGKESVEHVSATEFPGHYPHEDHAWDFAHFQEHLAVTVNSLSDQAIEFDLVGVDASVANAFRRIVIAEVPTIAIETVYVWNNTTIVQDEVLAQRLGLIPLHIDPRKLQSKQSPEDEPTDLNTVVFNLVARCERRKDVKKGEKDSAKVWTGTEVLSSQLEFDPKGSQAELFGHDTPRAAASDILLAKMRGGQEIVAELHCNKGIGKDHAKWSPVATASYRLLPRITLKQDIPASLHVKFAACFPSGVVDISSGSVRIVNARADTVSREVLRHAEFEELVELGRIRDHFIFSIESAGQYNPDELFPAAGDVLLAKIRNLRQCLRAAM